MTPPTVSAELTIVNVVARVAVAAASPQEHLGLKRLPVASVAADGAVRAFEHESCLRVVVETPSVPVDRGMARRAVVRETTLMGIIIGMAGTAVFRCIAEYLCLVTRSAFCVGVFAKQGELRQAVVEEQVVVPGVLIVTIGTCTALGSVVRVVVFVAFATTRERLRFEQRLDMAS